MSYLDLLADLNEEQRRAVVHPGGPALVVAGAGSGKTRVLTHRIAHLLANGISPRAILAVTFTNKAAAEMKQRVERLSGPMPDLWIGTFHSMCARFLRLEISKLGMQPNFTIIDDQDQLTVLKETMRELHVDEKVYRPNALREQIGRAKNRLRTPQQVQEHSSDREQDTLARVYQAYQRKLFANNSLDFDDLLMATVKLLQKDPATLAGYQEKFLHILVDEYQDTNHAQYQLVRLLAGKHPDVFVVGDEDQSIYSFRGAEIHNILDFERDFPSTTVYRLQQNYRSTQRILNAANALIRNNRQRKGKMLWTENGEGEKVRLFCAADEHEEVAFILDSVEFLRARGENSLKGMVIFYRIHALSRVLEEGLRRRGIPYGIVGGVGFYERKEVKDALAYLRVLSCPSDSISLKRILNVPMRGIGASTLNLLQEIANTQNIPLFQAMAQALSAGKLPRKAHEGISKVLLLVKSGATQHLQMGITGTLAWVLEESGYMAELRQEKTIEARTRLENLRELSSATEEFEATYPGAGLENFLADIALWTDLDRYKNTDERVTLMSLHSSKGLEFPHVFIAGLEEGIFPYSLWGMNAEELEEERRLLYVGMTRARKTLSISCAENRMLFGTHRDFAPSRFLAEIEGEFLERVRTDFTRDEEIAVAHIYEDVPRMVSPLASYDFHEGERILHPKFGLGQIITCFDRGESMKVTIKFQREESPRLLAVKYANLQKVDGKNRN